METSSTGTDSSMYYENLSSTRTGSELKARVDYIGFGGAVPNGWERGNSEQLNFNCLFTSTITFANGKRDRGAKDVGAY